VTADPEPYCSIIVATRNRPGALAGCLAAICEFDYPHSQFEVIVVDDGGSTPLAPLLEPIRDRFSVRLIVQQHAGPGAARNTGAREAAGELLVFTDDDCRPDSGWLRNLVDAHRVQPGSGLGGCTINAHPENPYADVAQLVITVGYTHNNRLPDDARFFASNNLAVPRTDFFAVGCFDGAYMTSEDRDFCARWVLTGRNLVYVQEALVRHASALTLRRFWRQNVAYGRGAFRFHRDEALRTGRRVPIEPAFYSTLLRDACRGRSVAGAAARLSLLAVWHIANSLGFAAEWWRLRRERVDARDGLHFGWSGAVSSTEFPNLLERLDRMCGELDPESGSARRGRSRRPARATQEAE